MTRPSAADHIISLETTKRLVVVANNPLDQVIIICLRFCGMRVGELAHMKRSWWDGNNIIIPPKQPCSCYECTKAQRNEKKKGFWTPKSKMGARTIPVHKNFKPILDSFFAMHKEFPLQRVRVWQRLKVLAKRAGLRGNVFPHAMRASFITGLIESEVSTWYIRQIVGHENITTTDDYVKFSPKKIEDEMKKAWR